MVGACQGIEVVAQEAACLAAADNLLHMASTCYTCPVAACRRPCWPPLSLPPRALGLPSFARPPASGTPSTRPSSSSSPPTWRRSGSASQLPPTRGAFSLPLLPSARPELPWRPSPGSTCPADPRTSLAPPLVQQYTSPTCRAL